MLRKNLIQMVTTLILVFILIYIFSVFSYANRLFRDDQVLLCPPALPEPSRNV